MNYYVPFCFYTFTFCYKKLHRFRVYLFVSQGLTVWFEFFFLVFFNEQSVFFGRKDVFEISTISYVSERLGVMSAKLIPNVRHGIVQLQRFLESVFGLVFAESSFRATRIFESDLCGRSYSRMLAL